MLKLGRKTVALFATVLALLLFGAGTAAAHDTLGSVSPADGSTVRNGPAVVRVDFEEPVAAGFCSLVVLGPDGSHWEAGPPTVSGNTVSAPVRPLGPAGDYRIEYRITSDDGHPVSGSTRFTLAQNGSGTPAATPVSASTATDAAPPTPGFGPWPWIAGVVVILGAAVLVGRRVARS